MKQNRLKTPNKNKKQSLSRPKDYGRKNTDEEQDKRQDSSLTSYDLDQIRRARPNLDKQEIQEINLQTIKYSEPKKRKTLSKQENLNLLKILKQTNQYHFENSFDRQIQSSSQSSEDIKSINKQLRNSSFSSKSPAESKKYIQHSMQMHSQLKRMLINLLSIQKSCPKIEQQQQNENVSRKTPYIRRADSKNSKSSRRLKSKLGKNSLARKRVGKKGKILCDKSNKKINKDQNNNGRPINLSGFTKSSNIKSSDKQKQQKRRRTGKRPLNKQLQQSDEDLMKQVEVPMEIVDSSKEQKKSSQKSNKSNQRISIKNNRRKNPVRVRSRNSQTQQRSKSQKNKNPPPIRLDNKIRKKQLFKLQNNRRKIFKGQDNIQRVVQKDVIYRKRKSSRNRVKPLQYWKSEKTLYLNDNCNHGINSLTPETFLKIFGFINQFNSFRNIKSIYCSSNQISMKVRVKPNKVIYSNRIDYKQMKKYIDITQGQWDRRVSYAHYNGKQRFKIIVNSHEIKQINFFRQTIKLAANEILSIQNTNVQPTFVFILQKTNL